MYKQYKSGSTRSEVVSQADSKRTDENELIPDDPVINKVSECWKKIESQCKKYQNNARGDKSKDDDELKTVRIFVSSTFTDFFCEREVLVKKVFPELREWCRDRMLYLIDCDMRWGVPKDTTTADTIAICLDELERCAEETDGQPFFLNMIGERYGWIPAHEDIPEDMQQKYDWVPDTSITFMEILQGAYRCQNHNAIFMLRDQSVIENVPEDLSSRYIDKQQLESYHLKTLKANLHERFPDQVYEYSCKMDGTKQIHGKNMLNITNLDDFCDKVLTFFKSSIDRMYPDRQSKISSTDSLVITENADQKKYIEELTRILVGRKKEADMIMSYINGGTDDLKLADSSKPFARSATFWTDLINYDNSILWLTGPSGHGKTTLLGSVAQQAAKNGVEVFYHFVDCTGNSHNTSLLLHRLIAFLKDDHSAEFLESLYKTENDKLLTLLRDELISLHKTSSSRNILLIFDALDQLSTANDVSHLNWLAPKFPKNIQCIVSSTQQPSTAARIQEYPCYMMILDTLVSEDARTIVEQFLLQFNKKLDSDQLNHIVESKCSTSPLWLYFICEELRIYGDFRSLTKQVHHITESMESTIRAVILRLIDDDDTGCMNTTLCLLACQYGQMTSHDYQQMLGNISNKEPLAALMWAIIRRSLSSFLKTMNKRENMALRHSNIKSVIYDTLVKNTGNAIKWYTILADYIEYWSDDKQLKKEALPWHLKNAKLRKRIVHFVRCIPESSMLPTFRRSSIISECRCRSLADPVIKGVAPVYICTFCKHQKAKYYPNAFHRNEDMCVVCGNQIFSGHVVNANMCQFHSVHTLGRCKCLLCDKILDSKMMIQGRLCMNCGFGNGGKQCAALDAHL
ncbi:hypothetical protein ACF0H5_008404 [Mactra antiquata]